MIQDVVCVEANAVDFKGRMQIFVNGSMIYSKGGFNPSNPQPTPSEAENLIAELFPDLPMTSDESSAFQKLHAEQIIRGQSKH